MASWREAGRLSLDLESLDLSLEDLSLDLEPSLEVSFSESRDLRWARWSELVSIWVVR